MDSILEFPQRTLDERGEGNPASCVIIDSLEPAREDVKKYPVIITQDDTFYVVDIPDFDLGTQGESIEEAIEMARDLIAMAGRHKLDEGETLPEPSPLASVITPEATAVVMVSVDFDDYRHTHDISQR